MDFQATAHYEDLQNVRNPGWSEKVIVIGQGSYDDAFKKAQALFDYRNYLLASNIQQIGLVVSDVSVLGDSTAGGVVSWPTGYQLYNITFNPIGSPGNLPVAPQTTLKIRCDATSLYRRTYYLHGMPQFAYNPSGANPYSSLFVGPLTNFANRLKNGNYGSRFVAKTAPTNQKGNITGITPSTGTIEFTWQTPPGLQINVGDRIRVSRCRGVGVPKGVYKVMGVAAGSVTINWIAPSNYSYQGGGTVATQNLITVAYTNATSIEMSEHRVGRSGNSYRGRR